MRVVGKIWGNDKPNGPSRRARGSLGLRQARRKRVTAASTALGDESIISNPEASWRVLEGFSGNIVEAPN